MLEICDAKNEGKSLRCVVMLKSRLDHFAIAHPNDCIPLISHEQRTSLKERLKFWRSFLRRAYGK